MADGMYLSGAGMIARQVWQDAVSENVANVSTPGYKASRVFSEVLGEVQASAAGLQDVARSQKIYTDFSQGPIDTTGRDLDVALEGDGFFVVSTPNGERYSRDGSFSLDPAGTLVDSTGAPVLTDSGPVTLQGSKVSIGPNGEIAVDGNAVGTLRLENFASTTVLEREGKGHFAVRAGATPESVPATARVRQGSLERSNSDGLDEMVRMMSLMREYEASERVLKMQSETMSRAVNEIVQR